MEKKGGATAKGTMVLATVKGDVHDIGKNLVDIILTNNGYKVVNLGIKQTIESILEAHAEHQSDAIGMSGLLVKSTLVMKENLELMNERGINVPVVLGGAALNRRYVDEDLRPLYKGQLFYARDAFAGLHTMDKLATATATPAKPLLPNRKLPSLPKTPKISSAKKPNSESGRPRARAPVMAEQATNAYDPLGNPAECVCSRRLSMGLGP